MVAGWWRDCIVASPHQTDLALVQYAPVYRAEQPDVKLGPHIESRLRIS
jgi:hypothetical protein